MRLTPAFLISGPNCRSPMVFIVEEQQGQGRAEPNQQSRHDQVPLLPRRQVHEAHMHIIGKVQPEDEAGGLRANALAVR